MKKRLLAVGMIIISLLCMLFILYDRVKIESRNKGVEIILDYYDIEKLANQSDESLEWWFKKFKRMGATSVAIEEESLLSLKKEKKNLELIVVDNIVEQMGWRDTYPQEIVSKISNGEIDKYDLVAITDSNELFAFIEKGLKERYPDEFFSIIEDGAFYIIIDGSEEDALYTSAEIIRDVNGKNFRTDKYLVSSKVDSIGLGFDKEKVELIKSTGLNVITRPRNFSRYSERLVEAYINATKELDMMPSTIIFHGNEILGYGGSQDDMVNYLVDNNIKIGLIEDMVQRQHIEQKGLYELSQRIDYNSVRVFSIVDWIQKRYKYYGYEGAEEIENIIYRAVTERNIRSVYFRAFKYDDFKYVTDVDEYERTFNSLEKRLSSHGIHLGNSTVMENYSISPFRLGVLGTGLVIFGIILLELLFKLDDKIRIALAIIGVVGVFGAAYFAPSIADKVLALGASIIFPSLSFGYLLRKSRKIIIDKDKKRHRHMKNIIADSIITLVVSVSIALLGGLYIGAILSDIRYLLEIDIYRGVKISQLLPLVIFALLYFSEFGYNRVSGNLDKSGIEKKEILAFLDISIKIKYVIGGLVLLVVGYIYIARTGHETNIQPSNIEMIFRNFLERIFVARPRTKELLLAFPSIIICVYMAYKKYSKLILPFAFAGGIGFTSVANTFSHLRTPLYLSLVRTCFGIILGAILGIVVVIVLENLIKVTRKLRGEK